MQLDIDIATHVHVKADGPKRRLDLLQFSKLLLLPINYYRTWQAGFSVKFFNVIKTFAELIVQLSANFCFQFIAYYIWRPQTDLDCCLKL